jgi:hypothetical protein
MVRAFILATISVVLITACGDNGDDAPAIDAAAAPDSDPNRPDGNPDIPDAGPASPDAGAGAVLCGAESCDLTTQECCVEQGGGGAGTCVDTGTCTGQAFQCDGAEDCPTVGEVCCFGAGNPQDPVSECVAAASCETPTCDTAADCADPTTDQCCAIGTVMVCVDAPVCPGA